MTVDVASPASSRCLSTLVEQLLRARAAPDHWEGRLASSALSTGTAVLALHVTVANSAEPDRALEGFIHAGSRWLMAHQNADGGWGDTVRSRSNISTTAIVWATLSCRSRRDDAMMPVVQRAEVWLHRVAGGTSPHHLRTAILRRYGKDQTFSAPILTVLALAGKLGTDPVTAWRSVPQLPFELAALPHAWFQHLRLPVVSYALPALIAIGQVRHRFAATRNPVTRALRNGVRARTHRVLREMQPESGGYLEATPLTSFVTMSLSGAGQADSPVVGAGVKFLTESMRPDGSWPIDTNLATWVTTLSIEALAEAGALPVDDVGRLRQWLLRQQSVVEHPFTHAAPGAWAWTPLSGGVPDADDTAGALVALSHLGEPDASMVSAAAAGARWLLGVQNRDGGVPTFCRGWGTLPFDKSTPEITAHALRGWSAWHPRFEPMLRATLQQAAHRAVGYLQATQTAEGSWIPLWFGNEHAPSEDNPVYGTARVLAGLGSSLARHDERARTARAGALRFLLAAQNGDGGWGGNRGVVSSLEETAVVVSAIARSVDEIDAAKPTRAIHAATQWMIAATCDGLPPAAPLGLYFARLWYYEDLYPLIFAVDALAKAER